jgi:hypothetical protein
MIDLDKLSLKEKLKLYAQGDWEQGLTPQGFRLSKDDVKALLKAIDDSEKLQMLIDNVTCVSEVAENIKNGGRIE